MTDPLADYRAALAVTVQWIETWKVTKNPRAREAAMACARIAHERFSILERTREATRDYRDLVLIERRAEFDALADEVRSTIADCRQRLETWSAPASGRGKTG